MKKIGNPTAYIKVPPASEGAVKARKVPLPTGMRRRERPDLGCWDGLKAGFGLKRARKPDGFRATGNGRTGSPRRAATRSPVDRARTAVPAGRGDRPESSPPRSRLRHPRRPPTTGVAPWRMRPVAAVAGSPMCSRIARTSTDSVMKAMMGIWAAHTGQLQGNAS